MRTTNHGLKLAQFAEVTYVLEVAQPSDDQENAVAFLVAMAAIAADVDTSFSTAMLKRRVPTRVISADDCEKQLASYRVSIQGQDPEASCYVLAGRYTGKDHPVPFKCRVAVVLADGQGHRPAERRLEGPVKLEWP